MVKVVAILSNITFSEMSGCGRLGFSPLILKFTSPPAQGVCQKQIFSGMLVWVGTMCFPQMKNVRCLVSKLDIGFDIYEIQIPTPRTPLISEKVILPKIATTFTIQHMYLFYTSLCITLTLSNCAYRAPRRSWAPLKIDFCINSTPLILKSTSPPAQDGCQNQTFFLECSYE